MKRFILAAVAALFVAPTPARAEPITAAITAFAASSATAAFIVRIAVSFALSALAAALRPKPEKPRQPGIKTETTTTGGITPQSFIVGRYATAGNMAAPPYSRPNSGDTPNLYLTYVVDFSDLPGVTVERLIVNSEYVEDFVDAGPSGSHQLNGFFKRGGRNYVYASFYDGTQTEADPYMLGNFGMVDPNAPPVVTPGPGGTEFVTYPGSGPELPWQADMVGEGLCYAVVTFRYERRIFNSLPGVRFECLGIPLYDPRADSTVGGDGAQRWDDPATWAQTENPAVIVYNILRGIALPDGQVWGGRVQAADLPLASWFAAMNECDVPVALADGGSEPQYRAGYEVSVDQEPADVIDELLKACSGEVSEVGGVYKIRVGAPALPVFFFSDEDVVTDEPQRLMPYPGLEGVHNAITATHPAPTALWEAKQAPSLYNPAWEAEDGGRQLVASINLPAVASGTQVQRLIAAWIADDRRFRRHTLTLPPMAALLEPLDTVGWTSARNGYAAKVFEVGEISDNLVTCHQALAIRERDATDFDWNAATQQVPVQYHSTAPVVPPVRQVSGFKVSAAAVTDAAGVDRRPALRLAWDAESTEAGAGVDDATGLEYQVRAAGQAALVAQGTASDVEAGEFLLSEGILPGSYEVRARLVVRARDCAWTDWVAVVAPDLRLQAADLEAGLAGDVVAGASARTDLSALVDGFTGGTLANLEFEYEQTVLLTTDAAAAAAQAVVVSGPSKLQLPVAAWNWNANHIGGNLEDKPKIPASSIVTGDADFGTCFEFPAADNDTVGPAKGYEWRPGVVYAVRLRFKTVSDGTGVSNNQLGVSTRSGDTGLSGNQQFALGNYTVADGVVETTVWVVNDDNIEAFAQAQAAAFGLAGVHRVTQPGDNAAFHFRQNAAALGTTLQRVATFEVRDISAYVAALMAEAAADGHRAAAFVSETKAVDAQGFAEDAQGFAEDAQGLAEQAKGLADNAAAAALSSKETAVAVSSQGVGCLSDQFLGSGFASFGSTPPRVPNEVYATGFTVDWDLAAGTQAGVRVQSDEAIWPGASNARAFRIEAEFELVSGSTDGVGILFDWNSVTYRRAVPLVDMVDGPVEVGRVMLASAVVERPAGFDGVVFTKNSCWFMANYASGLGGLAAKHIKLHRFQIYPINTTDAKVIETAAAVASLDGRVAAYAGFKVQAGNAVSLLDLFALDDGEAPVSIARLAADNILLDGTVYARHLLVGDFTNYADGSDFEDPARNPWVMHTGMQISSAFAKSGVNGLQIDFDQANSSALNRVIACQPFDVFHVEFWVRAGGAWDGDGNFKLRFGNAVGNAIIAAFPYGLADTTPTKEWHFKSGEVVVPAGCYSLAVSLFKGVATAGGVVIDDIVIQKKAGGKLVVDGALQARHVDTGDFSAAGLAVFGGALQSDDYSAGVSGWQITQAGAAEVNSLVVREDMLVAGVSTKNYYMYDDTARTISSTNVAATDVIAANAAIGPLNSATLSGGSVPVGTVGERPLEVEISLDLEATVAPAKLHVLLEGFIPSFGWYSLNIGCEIVIPADAAGNTYHKSVKYLTGGGLADLNFYTLVRLRGYVASAAPYNGRAVKIKRAFGVFKQINR